MELPVELSESIIDFALNSEPKSTTDILNFALVSRSWTPRCRYHLELYVDDTRVRFQKLRRLTDLCQHPLCTLNFTGALFLSNVGHMRTGLSRNPLHRSAVNALLSRRFSTGEQKGNSVLESVFTHLTKLTIERVGWWTLNDIARRNLHSGFRSVTQLCLRSVSFMHLDQFHHLICSFPALETLRISLIEPDFAAAPRPPVEPVKDSSSGPKLPLNLRSIESTTIDMATPDALSMLTPCPSLRHFLWRSDVFYRLEEKECRVVGEFLASAGPSLIDLSIAFNVDSLSNDIKIRRPDMDIAIQQFIHFHDHIDLTKNPSLQTLTLDVRPDPNLVPFLKHALPLLPNEPLSIRSLSIPFLENVIFELKSHIHPSHGLKGTDLVSGLQHSALANVEKLGFEPQGFFPRQTAAQQIEEMFSGLVGRAFSVVANQ